MVEQDPSAEVVKVPKFDMPFYESKLSKKDVKALAKKYDIPLDLHPCAPSEGWMMDKLPEEIIDQRAIPDAMAWRHHDSDVNDILSDGDYSVSDA
ncbi:hypothetical protein Tco_1121208 [Tanacetum coccineum]|uniref:Uncharacterized protein n=1 Tax=Tanacetum coccineum TaxID=301880 RepID=A0ABQ5IX41_9ASTR